METELELKYRDPNEYELKNIFDKLKECKTHDEIHKLIDETLPGWLVDSIEDYSDDYEILRTNWYKICENLKISPKKIILVEFIGFDPKKYLLLQILCERMTREGYLIRQCNELIKCKVCNKAIPNFELYTMIKQKGYKIPKKWSSICMECNY